ncbi:conserved hypothetical protein [Candidatus Zixiibacteriota bacterium]|nr:conserved hypothetical protein [candidate division Zixibacteria bacterium]
MGEQKISRRDFIKNVGLAAGTAAAGLSLGLPAFAEMGKTDAPMSRVVLIRNEEVVLEDGGFDAGIIQSMLDEAATVLFNEKTASAAWKKVVGPEDIVGIKTNGWRYLPTPPELETAIKTRVMEAGVPAGNISMRDRGVIDDPVFQKATALINTRPMRAHAWAGVGSLIKNYIMFVPEPWAYHDNSCASLGSIWHKPEIKGKTRLNVLVMLTPQFHILGPHHFDKKFVWNYGGLLVGTDPVAVDATGLRIIQARRKDYFKEEISLKPVAHHIEFADREYNLGTSDKDKIEVIKRGWPEGILI